MTQVNTDVHKLYNQSENHRNLTNKPSRHIGEEQEKTLSTLASDMLQFRNVSRSLQVNSIARRDKIE